MSAVILMLEWPRMAWMVLSGVPKFSSRLAQECLKS